MTPLDYATVADEVTARDREVANRFTKDGQITAIRAARGFLGDRLGRVVAPHRLADPEAGPLIAVKLHILTRKTLGGLETDLDSRVLKADGTPLDGLYAAGEVAGFGGGGVHGYRALEGTFLGGCIFSGRGAGPRCGGRHRLARATMRAVGRREEEPGNRALEGDGAFLGQHLEVGVRHLGEPAVVDAACIRGDDALMDGHRPGRRHRPQVVDRLGDLHPWCGRGCGQHVHRLVRDEQRIAGMHEPCGMFAVADEVRHVVDHRNLWMDDGMPAAECADGQVADGQLVADMHCLTGHIELGGGLRVGVQRDARIGVEKRRKPVLIHVIGVLMGDHDCGETGDALKAVREGPRVEQHRGVAEVGENAGMTEMRELHVYDCALMGCRPCA